jgi:hypothetical protein
MDNFDFMIFGTLVVYGLTFFMIWAAFFSKEMKEGAAFMPVLVPLALCFSNIVAGRMWAGHGYVGWIVCVILIVAFPLICHALSKRLEKRHGLDVRKEWL